MLMMFVCKKVFVVGQKIRGKKKKEQRRKWSFAFRTGFRACETELNNAKILSIGFGVDPKAEWTSETFFRFPRTRFLDLFFISHGD